MSAAGTILMPPAKKPADQPEPGLANVKLRADVHRKLRTYASYRDEELVELLDRLLRPIAEKLQREMVDEIAGK